MIESVRRASRFKSPEYTRILVISPDQTRGASRTRVNTARVRMIKGGSVQMCMISFFYKQSWLANRRSL